MDSQLEALLDCLLEEEGARHSLLDALSQELVDTEVNATAVVEGLNRIRGGASSTQKGDIAEKVLTLKFRRPDHSAHARPSLGCRKVEQVLPLNASSASGAFLKQMVNCHCQDMQWVQAEAIPTGDK